ncbi:MAG: CoA transferase [Chloroflexi bacterium]|nr:CoA transferase [Chloroflexota bacterium]
MRILDFTHWLAGPAATAHAAELGAQVIKVESIQHYDGARARGIGPDHHYEYSPTYNHFNRNKLGITLNLQDPQGATIARQLVKISDVVIDNFPAGLMERFGLGYEALRALNPTIVLISMAAFGQVGPWRTYHSFASPMAQFAGLYELTGEPGGDTCNISIGGLDPVTGILGGFALMTALQYRQRTGKGIHIDYAQMEAATTLTGDVVADYSVNGRNQTRRGNAHPFAAPHGAYPCRESDTWVAIAVFSDDEFQGLCRAMGREELLHDRRFSTGPDRWSNRTELDALVAQWTAQHEPGEATVVLQAHGVAAGTVHSTRSILEDPQLRARGVFEEVERAYVGRIVYPVSPMRVLHRERQPSKPAPTLGEHNELVLGEVLGLPQRVMEELARDQVIGKESLATEP